MSIRSTSFSVPLNKSNKFGLPAVLNATLEAIGDLFPKHGISCVLSILQSLVDSLVCALNVSC